MELEQFLKQSNMSQHKFGQLLTPPVSQGQVSQWIRGVTAVTLSYALQIEEISGHLVTPRDCEHMYLRGKSIAPGAVDSTFVSPSTDQVSA